MEKRFEEIMSKKGKMKGTTLTDEEILYMLEFAARKEISMRDPKVTLKLFETYEDLAHDIFTYLLLKDMKGKQGIRWMQENQTVEHIKNSLFFFVRNEFNGNLRKKKVLIDIYDTISLDTPITEDKEGPTITNVVAEKLSYVEENETNSTIVALQALECISDIEDERYYIKYKDTPISKFSFRKFAKVLFDIACNSKIITSDISKDGFNLIYVKENNKLVPVSNEIATSLLNGLRKNINSNEDFMELMNIN